MLTTLVTDACLWPAVRAILSEGLHFQGIEQQSLPPVRKEQGHSLWLILGTNSWFIFLERKGHSHAFPHSSHVLLGWKCNLSMVEWNWNFCHSQNCSSEWGASDHLHFPYQQIKFPLSYLVAHIGHWLSTAARSLSPSPGACSRGFQRNRGEAGWRKTPWSAPDNTESLKPGTLKYRPLKLYPEQTDLS